MLSHTLKTNQYSDDSRSSSSSSSLSLSSSLTSPSLSPYTDAVQVRSVAYPDTITVYFDLKQQPVPVGLIPGAKVVFYKFEFKQTQSGNCYVHQCSSSSLQLLSFPSSSSSTIMGGHGEREDHVVSPEMLRLPVTCFNMLISKLMSGKLSRRIVAVRAVLRSVQQASLMLACQTCAQPVVDGACAPYCTMNRHALKQEARLAFSLVFVCLHSYTHTQLKMHLALKFYCSVKMCSFFLIVVKDTGR